MVRVVKRWGNCKLVVSLQSGDAHSVIEHFEIYLTRVFDPYVSKKEAPSLIIHVHYTIA